MSTAVYHFTLGASVGGTERALRYNLEAGQAAVAASAFGEAATRLQTALELGIVEVDGDDLGTEQLGDLNHVDAETMLFRARGVTILFTFCFGLALALWTRRHFGAAVALSGSGVPVGKSRAILARCGSRQAAAAWRRSSGVSASMAAM